MGSQGGREKKALVIHIQCLVEEGKIIQTSRSMSWKKLKESGEVQAGWGRAAEGMSHSDLPSGKVLCLPLSSPSPVVCGHKEDSLVVLCLPRVPEGPLLILPIGN